MLISVIVITIVTTLGIGILNIALKDLVIANIQKESIKAFSAADAGIECAFAYDVNPVNSPPPATFASPLFIFIPNGFPPPGSTITCNNTQLATDGWRIESPCGGIFCLITELYDESGGPGTPLQFDDGSCVFIEVRKILVSAGRERTEIEAKGRSNCNASRRLERTLLLRWESI